MRLKVSKRNGICVYKCGDIEVGRDQYLKLRGASKMMITGGSSFADENAVLDKDEAESGNGSTLKRPTLKESVTKTFNITYGENIGVAKNVVQPGQADQQDQQDNSEFIIETDEDADADSQPESIPIKIWVNSFGYFSASKDFCEEIITTSSITDIKITN